jgi:hypothetical protein
LGRILGDFFSQTHLVTLLSGSQGNDSQIGQECAATDSVKNQVLAPISRVARWNIFKPKIPIWVNFEEPYLHRMENVGIFHVHLEYIYYGHLV